MTWLMLAAAFVQGARAGVPEDLAIAADADLPTELREVSPVSSRWRTSSARFVRRTSRTDAFFAMPTPLFVV